MPPPSGEGRVKGLEDLIKEHGSGPVLFLMVGLYALLTAKEHPCRRCLKTACACAPVRYRTAGPWRGPGSFGKGFGPQGSRR